MRRMAFGVVLVLLVACGVDPVEEVESQESSVIDGDKLPGGCNNPLICRTGTPPGDEPTGGGGGQQMCIGCVCTSDAASCSRCESDCARDKFNCTINGGTHCGDDARLCREACGGTGLTCACPR
jgi:hypothetical protein